MQSHTARVRLWLTANLCIFWAIMTARRPLILAVGQAISEDRVCRSFVYFVLPIISGLFEAASCALKTVAGLL